MAVDFRIQHLSHGGSVVSTHTPVGGTLAWNYKANEVGDIAYQLPLSDPAITQDSFAPYITDFRLQMSVDGGAWQSLMAGIHVPTNLVTDQDAVNVAGKDWAHWLEQPIWFTYYDYNWDQIGTVGTRQRDIVKDDHRLSGANPGSTASGSGYIIDTIALLAFTPGVLQSAIVRKLLDKSTDGGWRSGSSVVSLNPVFTGTAGASDLALTNGAYIIQFQDTTTILQHINNIAALDEPYGFDWTINANKTMEFFTPRKIVKEAPVRTWTFNKTTDIEQPVMSIDWTNNGPVGTHIVGLSIGSPAMWYHKRDDDSVDKYRGWLKLENVGDRYWKSPQMKYAVDGLQYMYPQKDVKIVVLPEVLDNLDPGSGYKNHIGEVIRTYWEFDPYHIIDAYYWITEQSFTVDSSGNYKCDLGLQQIYNTTTRTSGGV